MITSSSCGQQVVSFLDIDNGAGAGLQERDCTAGIALLGLS
jgi:hypothetical protein